MFWDYHVVLLDGRGRVWDLDTRLALPLAAGRWLRGSFLPPGYAPAHLEPRFRVVEAESFRAEFASDRRHMRAAGGGWRRPPPPWAPIGQGYNLPRYLDWRDPAGPGTILGLRQLRRWLAGRATEGRASRRRDGAPASPGGAGG
jgi:hypothetical protein